MKSLVPLMLAAAFCLAAVPAQALEAKAIVIAGGDGEMHCFLPYPIDPCLQDYIDWLLSVRGPINLVCTLVTGNPDPCVESA